MSLKMKYFVLKPRSKSAGDRYAAASRKAMRAYAYMIMNTDAELYGQLIEWANKESERDISLYSEEELGKITTGRDER